CDWAPLRELQNHLIPWHFQIKLNRSGRNIWTVIMKKDSHEKINNLVKDYAKYLPDKIDEIDHHWVNMQNSAWDSPGWDVFYRAVHTLHGSAGTYGFDELSKILGQLQIIVKPFVNSPPTENDCKNISKLVHAAKDAIKIPP